MRFVKSRHLHSKVLTSACIFSLTSAYIHGNRHRTVAARGVFRSYHASARYSALSGDRLPFVKSIFGISARRKILCSIQLIKTDFREA